VDFPDQVQGRTALHHAVECQHVAAVQWLLQHGHAQQVHLRDKQGKTALMLATRSCCNSISISNSNSNNISNSNSNSNNNSNIDDVAGCLSIVQMLIQQGADLEALDHVGRTAFLYACYYGQQEVVQYLHKVGACVDVRDQVYQNYHCILSR
jgi:ankyrin repeat protein